MNSTKNYIKKEKGELNLIVDIRRKLDELWDREFRVFLYDIKVKNSHKVMGDVLSGLFKLGQELKVAIRDSKRQKNNRVEKLIVASYNLMNGAHGLCWDILNGKGDYNKNAKNADKKIKSALRYLYLAAVYQQTAVKKDERAVRKAS